MNSRLRSLAPAAAVFLTAFLLVVLTTHRFGLHWDSTLFLRESIQIADWLRSWTDPSITVPPITDIEYYYGKIQVQPPIYRTVTGILVYLFGDWMGEVYAARILSALAYAFTAAGIYHLLRGWFGWDAGLAGSILFATIPSLFAFAHLNAADMLMTAVYFSVTASLPWALERKRPIAWMTLFYLAGFLTKVQGFWIPIVHVLWLLVEEGIRRARGVPAFDARWAGRVLVMAGFAAGVLFLPLWPYMILDGFRGLREYVRYIFAHGQLNVLYFGEVYAKPEFAPWHYAFVMPAITIPLSSLVLALAGAGVVVSGRVRDSTPRVGRGIREVPLSARARLWLIAPAVHLATMAMPEVPRHDGPRLLFMAFPFLAVLAGVGYSTLAGGLARALSGDTRRFLYRGIVLLAAAGIPLLENLSWYPYQLLYYNPLVGGPEAIIRHRFDGDYLGIYAQEAHSELNRLLPPSTLIFMSALNTGNYYGPACASIARVAPELSLNPRFRIMAGPQMENLIHSRGSRTFLIGGRAAAYGDLENTFLEGEKPVYTLERLGIPLVRLYRLNPPPDLPDPAADPLQQYSGAVLLRLDPLRDGAAWKALYYCSAPLEEDLALLLTTPDREQDSDRWNVIPHLVPFLSTRYWTPGDYLAVEYEPKEPIPPGSLRFTMVPHGISLEEVRFNRLREAEPE